jgi:spore maturation protein CgeB
VRIVVFCHSLLSDWNHGNAHFLRGVVTELQARGHEVAAYEPFGAWSVKHLVADCGDAVLDDVRRAYPRLFSIRYRPGRLDLDAALDGAQLVIVHEWNTPALVRRLGRHRRRHRRGYRLLFHDTHHRSVSEPAVLARYDLSDYDGVLAFGEVIRQRYLREGWAARAWTWHEAADTRVFRPIEGQAPSGDLVWIGNWGDDERAAELAEFLLEPAAALKLRTLVHGVRYPAPARAALRAAGVAYGGWLPNYEVPQVFARHRATVHVPRAPYARDLPGIPTIRPFEALACGIPLVSAPWQDSEGLFVPGRDFLVAENGRAMRRHLRDVLHDDGLARELAAEGRRTILARHTCAHRVTELLDIVAELTGAAERAIA